MSDPKNDQWHKTREEQGLAPKRAAKPKAQVAPAAVTREREEMVATISELRDELQAMKESIEEMRTAAPGQQPQSPIASPQTVRKSRRELPRYEDHQREEEVRPGQKPRRGGPGGDSGGNGSDDDEVEDEAEDPGEASEAPSTASARGRSMTMSNNHERSRIRPLTNKQLCPPETYCLKWGDVSYNTW